MEMTPDDLSALRRAVQSLEHPGLAARLTNMVGKPIELMGQALPQFASQAIATATSRGLEVALKVALRTMQESPHAGSQPAIGDLGLYAPCRQVTLRVYFNGSPPVMTLRQAGRSFSLLACRHER